jgi:hypothetical protein
VRRETSVLRVSRATEAIEARKETRAIVATRVNVVSRGSPERQVPQARRALVVQLDLPAKCHRLGTS